MKSDRVSYIKESAKDDNFEVTTKASDNKFLGFKVLSPTANQISSGNQHRVGTPNPEKSIFK